MQEEKIPMKEVLHVETDVYVPFDDYSSGLIGEETMSYPPHEDEVSQGYVEEVDISISVNGKQI
ncbi:hypothetical protein [Cytobacillus gottheilii]|uniref:hypothetical protein n=1 Tax=Cytobacillus gottheilii TaxID=859144 RepID=UPI0009B94CDF|nr:hypothetical protein [Cytobacillus gottheilii]